MVKIKKAVITAAGLGTRFLPITKSHPKEMIPLVDKPLIQYSVEEAVACGAELVVIVTSKGKSSIQDYFSRSFELENTLEKRGDIDLARQLRHLSEMAEICYVQQCEQLGLGHAVLTAKKVIGNEPFMLLLPDDLFEQGAAVLRSMIEIYEFYGRSVIAALKVPDEETGRYGIIGAEKITDRIYKVFDMVEKPGPGQNPSNLAIMGRYILTPEIFKVLEMTPPGKNGEIQLTDALKKVLKNQGLYAYEFEGERYDAGTQLGWLETTITMALRNPVLGPEIRKHIQTLLDTDCVLSHQ
jgi:UTP--glucose-1-phosphate uridylyltransferase